MTDFHKIWHEQQNATFPIPLKNNTTITVAYPISLAWETLFGSKFGLYQVEKHAKNSIIVVLNFRCSMLVIVLGLVPGTNSHFTPFGNRIYD